MSTTLEVKLRTAAAAYAPLTSLLGTNPFRWWDMQLTQGSAFPAVVVLAMPGSKQYSVNRRMALNFNRVQFTIWDVDAEGARTVESALADFLDQFNAIGVNGLQRYPCEIIGGRPGMFVETQPPKFIRIIDAMICNNDSI